MIFLELPFAMANATATRLALQQGICLIVRVPSAAFALDAVAMSALGCHVTIVVILRADPQVIRIAATRIVAAMTGAETRSYSSSKHLKNQPVSHTPLPLAIDLDGYNAVAVGISPAVPFHASRAVGRANVCEEPITERRQMTSATHQAASLLACGQLSSPQARIVASSSRRSQMVQRAGRASSASTASDVRSSIGSDPFSKRDMVD